MYAVILVICEISLDSILLRIDFVLGMVGRRRDMFYPLPVDVANDVANYIDFQQT